MLIMYTGTTCPFCRQVESFLDDKGIEYTYVDIDTEVGLELARDWAVRSVPSMSVDGKVYVGDKQIMEMFNGF